MTIAMIFVDCLIVFPDFEQKFLKSVQTSTQMPPIACGAEGLPLPILGGQDLVSLLHTFVAVVSAHPPQAAMHLKTLGPGELVS